MANNTIQVNYDQLDEINKRFGQQAEENGQMIQRLRRAMEDLNKGGWQGEGSQAFFNQMNDDVLPALQRLTAGLEEGGQVSAQVSQIYRQAEEEASNVLNGDGTPGATGMETLLASGAPGINANLSAFTNVGMMEGVPSGKHSAEHVRDWADFILKEPKKARKLLKDSYRRGDPLGPELLRQLSGWAASDNADPKAIKAYRDGIKMYKDIYGSRLGREELRLNSKQAREFGTLTQNERFIMSVANISGPGSGNVKADFAQFLLENIEGVKGPKDDSRAFHARLEYTKQLEELAIGPDADRMAVNLAAESDPNKSLRPILGAILENDKMQGENVVGILLGRTAIASAEQALLGNQEQSNETAYRLGKILAFGEIAAHDTYRPKSGGGPSVDHGAAIVNGALTAIDTLTAGASIPVTGPLRSGVGRLAEYEKGQEKPSLEPDSRDVLTKRLLSITEASYQYAVDPNQIKGNNLEVQKRIRVFQENVYKGREHLLVNQGLLDQIQKKN